MPNEREELEKQLRAKAEDAIRKLLEKLPDKSELTMTNMEDFVGEMGQEVMQAAIQEIAQSEQVAPSEMICEACEVRMQKRGKRKKHVVSKRGEIELERQYYVCPQCGAGVFPLDEQWELDRSVFTRELSRQMVWLSALVPYEQCEAVFAEIGEQWFGSSSIWRQTQKHGQRLLDYVNYQREQVSVERVQLPDAKHDHDQRKGVSMDGGMINIRDEGWREMKVGTVFDVNLRLERNPQTNELDEMAHGVNVHYTAVLGTKDEFTPALWALAVQHDLPTALNRSVVADGAAWIWNVAEDICPDGQQVVDWYHAVEHLHKASIALYPNEADVAKRQAWFKTYKNLLYMGHCEKIIAVLNNRNVPHFATYFECHKRRMTYLKFREEGLPIGSGTVESGVKQFKQRLCGTGMRWHGENAHIMLTIRSAVLGHDFHELWAVA